ncbi:O-antigen ligase family protein [Akkermansiaceae bacterium]|nr:O-antigen ligase family protein [Akkermansiaceae bacterium]MDB4282204.1 O-antigen ligase family protein [Akkermansiaceae bacterium]MDB4804608.1 O-antigen ligase family protein [Akkermansiaceae bacterium]MDC0286828.1 O-antigen ligase family protein [Akkermansiaceae bacterium]
MNSGNLGRFHSLILTIGIAVVLLMGVNLNYHSVGWGLLILGISGILQFSVHGKNQFSNSIWVLIFVLSGGAYFIIRGLLGGPEGLAVSESLLVLLFLSVYFGVSFASASIAKFLLIGILVMSWVQIGASCLEAFGTVSAPSEVGSSLPPVTGLFSHYNLFAAFANVSVVMLLAVVFFTRIGMGWKGVYITTILLLVSSVWLSGSRGGWLGLTGGLGALALACWWSLSSTRNPRASLVGIITVVGLVIGLSTAWAVISYKTSERFDGRESVGIDGDVRTTFQGVAFDLFLESPLIGEGSRAFSYRVIEDWDSDRLFNYTKDPEFVHNEILESLSSYGLVGVLFILLGLGIHGAKAAISVASTPQDLSGQLELALKLGSFGGVVALLLQSYFSFLMHIPALVGFMALLVGIQARGERKFIEKGISAWVRNLLLLLVSLLVCFAGYRSISSDLWVRKADELAAQRVGQDAKLQAIEALWNAGEALRTPKHYELAGQAAMLYSLNAMQAGDSARADQFSIVAIDSFEKALLLNPFSQVANCGIPRALDSQKKYDKAEKFHQIAIKGYSVREPYLAPNLHGARSSFYRAYDLLAKGELDQARDSFRLAGKRLAEHFTLVPQREPVKDRKDLLDQVSQWNLLLDGENLYRVGHAAWMKRDPERGLALMLAAKVRYDEARPVLIGRRSVWNVQGEKLLEHIAQIQAGQVNPADISKEKIEEIAAGLESPTSSR